MSLPVACDCMRDRHHLILIIHSREETELHLGWKTNWMCYAGCSEKLSLDSNCAEYLLVLSYCSNGSLQDYIRQHTLDFNTFCRMALSIAKGLAFLHTDIQKGGMWIELWVRLALPGLLMDISVYVYFPEVVTTDIRQDFFKYFLG